MAAETLMASETAAETSYPARKANSSPSTNPRVRGSPKNAEFFINTFRIEIDFIDKRGLFNDVITGNAKRHVSYTGKMGE